MTDQQFIQQESEKLRAKLRKQLRKVHETGGAGRNTIETLWFNGLIQITGPSASNAHNHYKLTTEGLSILEAK